MEENNTKPTYEELEAYTRRLLRDMNQITNTLNKLPFLFKVVENKDSFSQSFVDMCVNEIEEVMTPPSNNATEEKEA